MGSLLQAANGNFYGLTSGGGANSRGVIFQYDPVTNIYTKKTDFNGANCQSPEFNTLIERVTAPVPVKLLSFSGICRDQHSLLKWKTATETNSDHFSLKKVQMPHQLHCITVLQILEKMINYPITG